MTATQVSKMTVKKVYIVFYSMPGFPVNNKMVESIKVYLEKVKGYVVVDSATLVTNETTSGGDLLKSTGRLATDIINPLKWIEVPAITNPNVLKATSVNISSDVSKKVCNYIAEKKLSPKTGEYLLIVQVLASSGPGKIDTSCVECFVPVGQVKENSNEGAEISWVGLSYILTDVSLMREEYVGDIQAYYQNKFSAPRPIEEKQSTVNEPGFFRKDDKIIWKFQYSEEDFVNVALSRLFKDLPVNVQ